MSKPQTTDQYLAELRDQLVALGATDARDIVEEMRSHIADLAAEQPGMVEAELVSGLDDPRELASALLAGRASGATESSWPGGGAPKSRRIAAWLVDLVWALWVPALLWPVTVLGIAMLTPSPDPVGLLLSPATVVPLALVAASLLPAVWLVFVLLQAARNRRGGRPTLGTRAARLTPWITSAPVVWVDADSAPPGVQLPPVPHRGRARAALVLAIVLVLVGSLWVPILSLRQRQSANKEEATAAQLDARANAYQAGGEGWMRDIYSAALSGEIEAYIDRGDKGYNTEPEVLRALAADLKSRGVTEYAIGYYDINPVAFDDANPDRATVAIPVLETTPAGMTARLLRFTVIDPQKASSGADQTWTLNSIDAPSPAPVVK